MTHASEIDAIFNCRKPTPHGPCVLPAEHPDPCVGMPSLFQLCPLCKGRTRLPGTDDTCPSCGGTGLDER